MSDERVLRSFFADDGTLHTIPSKHAKLLVVLDRLAQEFAPGRTYPEATVNEVLRRFHPDHAALQLANLIFGGYFSSRWVENIREDKGYTYGPHSSIEHSVAGSALVVSAEVATEVTAPALLETWYELGRIAALPPGEQELEQARQYALGTLQLGMSTQAGLAGLAITYAGHGLRLPYLAEHSANLAAASLDEVAAVAAHYLAPARGVTVIVGDADRVADPLGALTATERATLPAAQLQ